MQSILQTYQRTSKCAYSIFPQARDCRLSPGQCLFASDFVYASAILAIKLSVLSFYRRVFSTRTFKLVPNLIGAVVIAWWIAVILVSIISCNPIRGFWDHTIKFKCINTESFFNGNAVPTIVTDVIILLLPLRMISNL